MKPAARYDKIGIDYARVRRPDPRIARRILEALGDAKSVVNVGAGAGSYEPADGLVIAVEPSAEMLAQRAAAAAPAVRAVAEHLPLADGSVDAALAVLTMHHWPDWRRGAVEMVRVARRRAVVFTFDPSVSHNLWIVNEYFPAMRSLSTDQFAFARVRAALDANVLVVPVPGDCTDGFLGAYWRRPAAYLDPAVRMGISAFHLISKADVDAGLRRLERDLRSGRWAERHGHLLDADEFDGGYRLLVREKDGAR